MTSLHPRLSRVAATCQPIVSRGGGPITALGQGPIAKRKTDGTSKREFAKHCARHQGVTACDSRAPPPGSRPGLARSGQPVRLSDRPLAARPADADYG
jgi:hypothetical protein